MCWTNKSDKDLKDRKHCEKCNEHSYCMYLNKECEWVCDKCIDKERESNNGCNTQNR